MNAKWWTRFSAVSIVAVLMITLGCSSSSNDKVVNSDTLSSEEQIALLDSFGGVEGIATLVLPAVLQGSGVALWDGVDQGDLPDYFSLLGSIGGLSKAIVPTMESTIPLTRILFDTDGAKIGSDKAGAVSGLPLVTMSSLSISYNGQSGWWVIDFDSTDQFSDSELEGTISVDLRDSVRFEMANGTAQISPDENTVRVLRGTFLDFDIVAQSIPGAEGGPQALTMGFDLTGEFDAMGLNTGVVTLNSTMDMDMGIDASGAGLEFDGEFGFAIAITDMVIPVTENPDDACPTDGTINVNIAVDFSVTTEELTQSAVAEWDMTLDINSNQTANVTVQSGDVVVEETVIICDQS